MLKSIYKVALEDEEEEDEDERIRNFKLHFEQFQKFISFEPDGISTRSKRQRNLQV